MVYPKSVTDLGGAQREVQCAVESDPRLENDALRDRGVTVPDITDEEFDRQWKCVDSLVVNVFSSSFKNMHIQLKTTSRCI